MAGSVGAAVPNADAVSAAIPASYTAGHAAGFRGTFHLTDGSTLSKLFLRVDLRTPTDATNVYLKVTRNGNNVTSACPAAGEDFVCTFKTVRNTDFFVAVAAYLPPASAEAVSMAFDWKSTGVPDNGDLSHGDSWDNILRTATLTADDVDYGGAFTIDGDTSVANGAIGPSNFQSARLVGLPVGVAATVLDGTHATGTCQTTATINCDTLFGDWIEVHVGDGLDFPVWQIKVTYASGTPKGFIRSFIGTDGQPAQEPVDTCAKKNPTYPCFTWDAKTKTATIFTIHSSSYRGH